MATPRHVVDANRTAREKWGAGWDHLSEEQRRGAIALEYLRIVAGQEAKAGTHAARIVAGASAIVEDP
jgi:hypothetical protein